MTAPRTWSAEASVEHARRVGHLTQRAATPESTARLIAVRDLMQEVKEMIQESIDLACAEMMDDGLTLQQIADGTVTKRSTVQGYVASGRALVQADAVSVEPGYDG